jgi:hypothetical protein
LTESGETPAEREKPRFSIEQVLALADTKGVGTEVRRLHDAVLSLGLHAAASRSVPVDGARFPRVRPVELLNGRPVQLRERFRGCRPRPEVAQPEEPPGCDRLWENGGNRGKTGK